MRGIPAGALEGAEQRVRVLDARAREVAAETLSLPYAEAEGFVRRVALREDALGGPAHAAFMDRVAQLLRAHGGRASW